MNFLHNLVGLRILSLDLDMMWLMMITRWSIFQIVVMSFWHTHILSQNKILGHMFRFLPTLCLMSCLLCMINQSTKPRTYANIS